MNTVAKAVMSFSVKLLYSGQYSAFNKAFKVSVNAGYSATFNFCFEFIQNFFGSHMVFAV